MWVILTAPASVAPSIIALCLCGLKVNCSVDSVEMALANYGELEDSVWRGGQENGIFSLPSRRSTSGNKSSHNLVMDLAINRKHKPRVS